VLLTIKPSLIGLSTVASLRRLQDGARKALTMVFSPQVSSQRCEIGSQRVSAGVAVSNRPFAGLATAFPGFPRGRRPNDVKYGFGRTLFSHPAQIHPEGH